MAETPRSERKTQNRVIDLFTAPKGLGYRYLGEWHKRDNNRCIEIDILQANLATRGYGPAQISSAIKKLEDAADTTGINLYQANLRTYQLLRYGVQVQTAVGNAHESVSLIDWDNPEKNDFALAEEVTLKGGYERRPDIVLYVNGIAVAVIELKRGSVEIANGVRQLITNQEPIFNMGFFSTVQLVLAGNDTQGLRYGTAGTKEEFFVTWKGEGEVEATDTTPGAHLDRPLAQMCSKTRLLDLIRNFIIFDAGVKKVPRPHQYFGVKAAQERIAKREGGVIWHTQGSGKSILMVLIAKWLMEHDPEARILIITDRDELDKQIEGVMRNADVIPKDSESPRITSRAKLVEKLGAHSPRLLCALIHKFDTSDLKGEPPRISGRFYVFVDECHRTQGGDMNRQMKRWMQDAIFIGFTGTPLLRKDKQLTRDVFGTYIHTYKFHQAVADKVVLDLKYEARNVPQQLTNRESIDKWFEQKTKGLNDYQKAVLRNKWATMESLLSAGERKQRIIADIIEDFGLKPRLNSDRGTAILVADEIYDACHYFKLFQNTEFGSHVGIVTSYEPNPSAISCEPPGSTERYKFDVYTNLVLKDKSKTTKQYEDDVKRRFKEEPANMKLIIVVSKLLTGFDAPSCSYIYLDHRLRDHTLFQAICRTNRLDGDDKDYGYIVDYKEMLGNVQEALAVYNSDELDTDLGGGGTNDVNIKNWLQEGKKQLDDSLEALRHLCEPVAHPREIEQYLRYFCGDAADPEALSQTGPMRDSFYKSVAGFVRAYAAISADMTEAGYTDAQAAAIQKEVELYSEIRSAIKKHSGEELDTKPYEADMRHLLNTYVQADSVRDLGNLGNLTLTELIIKTGMHDAIAKKLNAKGKLSKNAVAESIINNIRITLKRDQLTDPQFYEQMSKLLDDLIAKRRDDSADYEAFLKDAESLVKKISTKHYSAGVPQALQGRPLATVVYNNLPRILAAAEPDATADHSSEYGERLVTMALSIDHVMRESAPAGWKGDSAREAQVVNALGPVMNNDRAATEALLKLLIDQPGN